MAVVTEDAESEDSTDGTAHSPAHNGHAAQNGKASEEASDEEEEEEEEPRLKYASLTKHLKPVYRNGDATSTFLVAGDKMVGTSIEKVVSGMTDLIIDYRYT